VYTIIAKKNRTHLVHDFNDIDPNHLPIILQNTKEYVQRGDSAGIAMLDYRYNVTTSTVYVTILPDILSFLGRCEDETFQGVMSNVSHGDIGGDLKSPTVWIRILLKTCYLEPSCSLQIAENIGPLVKCMCNDTKRLFFKSNVYWAEAILAFVDLVSNILLATSPSTTTTAVYNTTTGRPRRNMSAFFLYSNGSATRQAVKERNPGMSYEDIAKQLHKQFKELSSKERQFWDERALDDMLRHNRELAAYTSSNNNSSVHTFLKIVDALLNHDGLLTSIIQWGFSGVESSSIPEEIGMFTCVNIATLAKVALGLLVKSALKTGDGVGTVSITPGGKLVDTVYFRNGIGLFTKEGRERLQCIGRTAITTYLHDRTRTVSSYVAGLIRKVETEGWGKVDFVLLRCLIRDVGCVDKEVITEMIGLGINASSSTLSSAGLGKILELSTYMVTRKDDTRATGEDLPRDTLVAFAVREGLIDMCLSFIEKYGKLTFFLKQHSNRSLFDHISHLLKVVHDVLLHKKTWKAIRHERHNIEDKLVSLQSDTTNNPKCKKLLDMVRSIIDMNGSYCCRCNKSLSRTEVECNRYGYS